MSRKKVIVPNTEAQESVFAAAARAITDARELKVKQEGMTQDGRRRWTRRPKALRQFDKMEVAGALRIQGQSWKQVAEVLNLAEETVRSYPHDPRFQKIFAQLLVAFKEEQKCLILSFVPDAIRTLHDLLDDRSGHVRYEAAQALITHAALDQLVRETVSESDFQQTVDDLRKKAAGPRVQVNVGVVTQAPGGVAGPGAGPVIDAEVRQLA